jgi:hypothetical protein
MDRLGDELNLTETAMNVAEAALFEEVTPMDISFNSISMEWTEYGNGPSWQQTHLEKTATEWLGDELRLTETAIDVAESALQEMQINSEDDDYYPPEEEFCRSYYKEEDYDY